MKHSKINVNNTNFTSFETVTAPHTIGLNVDANFTNSISVGLFSIILLNDRAVEYTMIKRQLIATSDPVVVDLRNS